MNQQMMTLWGQTLMSALQGQNQVDMLANWFQKAIQDFNQINSNLLRLWGIQPFGTAQNAEQNMREQYWDAFQKMQRFYMAWVGMIPQNEYIVQADKVTRLEEKIAEQTRTIEKLQNLINTSGQGNNELIHQFQDLIDQQSRQFQQLTASFSEYVKSNGAEKAENQS